MQPAKLNRQVTFSRRSVTTDPVYGTEVVIWVPLSYLPGSPEVAEKYWVELQDVLPSRSEAVRQGLASARDQTRLRMRWRSDVDSSQRVTVHGDTDSLYQIVSGPAEIMGRKVWIEMMLEKYTTAGTENV